MYMQLSYSRYNGKPSKEYRQIRKAIAGPWRISLIFFQPDCAFSSNLSRLLLIFAVFIFRKFWLPLCHTFGYVPGFIIILFIINAIPVVLFSIFSVVNAACASPTI